MPGASEEAKFDFLKVVGNRGPGKRMIKPSSAVLSGDLGAIVDDEEEDQDFKNDGHSGSGSDDSCSSGTDDPEESDDNDVSDLQGDSELVNGNVLNGSAVFASKPPICSVCLNLWRPAAKDEVMLCDRCGVAVHEVCYGSEIVDDTDSTHSAATTEPWFCEPCLYGKVEAPYCELCPSRYGAFKRTDIGGQWVHSLCSMYTPGCTYGDPDLLTPISYMEIDFSKNFGKKVCSGCPSRLEARVGISRQCDAGWCKQYFHPTCAQRLGLLVYNDGQAAEDTAEDIFLVHCKQHSQEEAVKRKRLAHKEFIQYEEKRRLGLRRKKLDERQERFRKRNLDRLEKLHKSLIGSSITWPGDAFDERENKQKQIRPLQTSMRVVEGFAAKAEKFFDMTREEFENECFKIPGEEEPFLPPGFSDEFIGYCNHREARLFVEEKKRSEELKEANLQLREELKKLEAEAQLATEAEKRLDSDLKNCQELYNTLANFGIDVGKNPFEDLLKQRSEAKKASPKKKSQSAASGSAPTSPVFPKKAVLHECSKCHKKTDQHSMIDCDACRLFTHIGCLNPPLEKKPKKSRFATWECSDCHADEDSGEEGVENNDDNEQSSDQMKKLRQRSDTAVADRKQKEADQLRQYCRAMANAKKPTKKTDVKDLKTASVTPKRSSVASSSGEHSTILASSIKSTPGSPSPKKRKRSAALKPRQASTSTKHGGYASDSSREL
ncbi:unnamed protein product, partial [Mesorhabditis spiculigera]